MTDAERISDLTSQLAAANERCAGLAAALDVVQGILEDAPELNPSNYDHEQACELNSKMVEAFLLLRHNSPSAILAAVREKAKREGAVEELGALLEWGPEYRSGEVSVTLTIKEYRDEIRRRIAALEGKE